MAVTFCINNLNALINIKLSTVFLKISKTANKLSDQPKSMNFWNMMIEKNKIMESQLFNCSA